METLAGAARTEYDLVHSAVFYRSEREYVDYVLRFVSDWLGEARPVLVAVPGSKIAWLRAALATRRGAAELVMTDITEAGRNPGRILGLQGDFVQRHRDRPVGIISEPVWPGRSPAEYPACVQHEALVNEAFAGQHVTGVCLYDASRLADSVVADARITHPLIWRNGSQQCSPDYAVDVARERGNQPLQTHPAAVKYTVGQLADLSVARRWSAWYGRSLGMRADGIADLQLVVTELATSSLQHGSPRCRLAFWYYDGQLVCEARDAAPLTDPLAGRRPPAVDGFSATGLFVVHAVADLVRTHMSRTGTTIHAYLRLDRPAGEPVHGYV